jgi:hypothetical protein
MKTQNETEDYGCDPVGDGTFRLVPSGRIVTKAERDKLLATGRTVKNDCLGLSWEQIEAKQGGKLRP